MQRILGWIAVVVLCCAARASARDNPPDARLQEAQTAFNEASSLWEAGRYADAVARGEHALALREAVLGDSHPDVATSLETLGHHHLLRGNLVRAEPLLQRALAIREAAVGNNSPEVAQTLTHLASLYRAQESLDRAEPLLERALAIREAAFGQDHPLVAEALNHLGRIYLSRGGRTRAEPLLERALAIREAALGNNSPEAAQTLHDLSEVYWGQRQYARAEALLRRALTIRETALGKDHLKVAETLLHLAGLYGEQGLSARARPLADRVVAIHEVAIGQNHPDAARVLLGLATLHMVRGGFARAESLFEQALALQEAALGKSHPIVAETLYRLALTYAIQGLYGRAEPLYERVLALREAAFGKSHPKVALPVVGLGKLYLAQGLYARAEPLLQRALEIRQAAYGEKNTDVALALGSLGSLYLAQGNYARAEPLLQRALAIQEAIAPTQNPHVAGALSKLGKLYLAQGHFARAEPLLRRALAIRQALYGENDPDTADSLQELADLYMAQRLYGKARPLLQRALASREALSVKDHPRNAEVLNQLAVGHLAQHRLAEALPLLTRSFAISEQRLRQETLGFSEGNLARFLQFLRADEERLYALLRAHPGNARVRRLALTAALLLKGRSVEETADISRAVYQSLGAQERDTFERLRGLRTQLARLVLQGPGGLSPAAYQQQLKELAEQGAALEAGLARRSAPLRMLTALPSPAEIVDRVAKAMPKDGALVEFITYEDRPLVPKPGSPEPRLRYLALVLFPDSTIRFRDLGPAEPINHAAANLRDALANKDASYGGLSQALYQLAFQPLLPLLGGTRRLFLSPDGQLALVPFAALHDGHQFLVESFDFTYLTSGKDLLPRAQETTSTASVAVLADPDFSARLPSPALSLAEAPAQAQRSSSVERFFSSLREGQAHRAWSSVPLPGTRQEAEAIQRLLPQAQLFLGREATKERLLQMPTPAILHLATHGFFLENAPAPPGSRGLGHINAMGAAPRAAPPPDPLLRSGLLFAGAAAPAPDASSPASPPPDSTLATALELAGLNLWGTQLVVLSACDTGRGDVQLGQGVYGLRRAFFVAGAETVVMSLWKVNDETTRQLMEAYYTNLLAGQGRASALREAMRELRRTQPHPHYWAPFIAMGRDAPLRGLSIGGMGAPLLGSGLVQ
jgi:CHAT domain-containing protein/Tfp pilus assembly protein PilF